MLPAIAEGLRDMVRGEYYLTEHRLIVYVAGPYASGKGSWAIEENVRKAEAAWLELIRRGYAAICMHTMTRFMYGTVDERDIMLTALTLVRRADAVFILEGWQHSRGTRDEMDEASRYGVPVFESMDELDTWAPHARGPVSQGDGST